MISPLPRTKPQDFRRKYLLILLTNKNVNLAVLIRMAARDETATCFVDEENKLKKIAYVEQGNTDYYSEENMFKRFVLMKSKAIRRCVDLWWNVAYQPKVEFLPKRQTLHKWQARASRLLSSLTTVIRVLEWLGFHLHLRLRRRFP